MATFLQADSTLPPTHHFALSRHFFIGWQHRSACRQAPTFIMKMSLIAQDMVLFEQLFALQDAILEIKANYEEFPNSSETSPFDSPTSTLSSLSSNKSGNKDTKRSASFVRQHISYPPIARNRSRRIKLRSPQHVCQDSYDSGIHNSDHEIFV
ncbi:hypothetical protein C0J52_05864 [Blattella germanica]|nr:hypothetical protein C0J52_05864 [Blattella germanica]